MERRLPAGAVSRERDFAHLLTLPEIGLPKMVDFVRFFMGYKGHETAKRG